MYNNNLLERKSLNLNLLNSPANKVVHMIVFDLLYNRKEWLKASASSRICQVKVNYLKKVESVCNTE